MIPDFAAHEPRTAPDEASMALEQLGLTPEILLSAARAGIRQAREITDFHPVTARGMVQWMETVASLRSSLAEHSWTLGNPKNSPRTFSPDGRTSVMVMGGDENTGSPSAPPQAARRRGPSTRATMQCNGQGLLDVPLSLPRGWADQDPLTWVLVYHWSRKAPRLQAELSLARNLDEDGCTFDWHHRILLPDEDLREFDIPQRPAAPDFDIDFRIQELK